MEKIEYPAPKNFPLRLYVYNNNYFLAHNKIDIINEVNISDVDLVDVNELVSANGHSHTHSILKSIGNEWICKGGNIFYA